MADFHDSFGDYALLERLNQSPTGTIYKARHRTMGRLAALKVLSPEACRSAGFVRRFERKMQILAGLKHPNLVVAYEGGQRDGTYYLVMEYIEGQNLASMLKVRGPLPIDEALAYLDQAAAGLGHAHAMGVCHRNVRPDHLMVNDKGVVKVLGFGLAHLDADSLAGEESGGQNLTREGTVLGTAEYMAPEQAVNAAAADARADIYSLGCTLYRLLTGRHPYVGRTPMQQIHEHATRPIPSLRVSCPEVPESVDRVFQKMLAKRPEDRYASMGEVRAALEGLRRRLTQAAQAAPTKRPSSPPPLPDAVGVARPEFTATSGTASVRKWPVFLALAGTAVAAAIAVGLLISGKDSADAPQLDNTASVIEVQVPPRGPVAARAVPVSAEPSGSPAQPVGPVVRAAPAPRPAAPSPPVPTPAPPTLTEAAPTLPTPPSVMQPGPEPPAISTAMARWTADGSQFTVVSNPTSPGVAYTVRRDGSEVELTVEVEAAPTDQVGLQVGVAGLSKRLLIPSDARAQKLADAMRYVFRIPSDVLARKDSQWSHLRLAVAVAWRNGSETSDRQRERFLHTDRRAPHVGLSESEQDWSPLDLRAHEKRMADLRDRIFLSVTQPMDGKASIVIEDRKGKRVRNLLSGVSLKKGTHPTLWDGMDDDGQPVPPGEYRYRAVHHRGITPEYLFSFGNGGNPDWHAWGPNHGTLIAAVAGKEWTFVATNNSEGGQSIMALDAQGTMRQSYDPPTGYGDSVVLAIDDRYLYAVHLVPRRHIDRTKIDTKTSTWKDELLVALARFDIPSGKPVRWGKESFLVFPGWEYGPGSVHPAWEPKQGLGGAACLGGKVYISLRLTGAVRIVDAETGKPQSEIKLPGAGPICVSGNRLVAACNDRIVRLDPATGAVSPVASSPGLSPYGMAVDSDGQFFISDDRTHTVRVFDPQGREKRRLGTPGGPYVGAYDPQRLVAPRGLAFAADGRLWITEGRWSPKRLSAWDPRTGKVLHERFGPMHYGATACGFDSADSGRWLTLGTLWDVDFQACQARPLEVLLPQGTSLDGAFIYPSHYRFVHDQRRTFVLSLARGTLISELLPGKGLHDCAYIGSCHLFSYAFQWKPPPAFIEAFQRAYSGLQGHSRVAAVPGRASPRSKPARPVTYLDHGPGVVWVDRNGDGVCQADEFDFAPECEQFDGCAWGHDSTDLTLRIPAVVDDRMVLATFAPQGLYPGGAPRYPTLRQALAKAKPIDLKRSSVVTINDRFGNVLANDDPRMKCFAPDGRLLWSFPNRWSEVHGSHQAPLPETGVMQGVIYFLGMAPLDDRADVFMCNGNHGRFFVLTSDGFYLDEMFRDIRVSGVDDPYRIQGEPFGGCFARNEKDGQYYLQSGSFDCRVFRIAGLDQVARSEGTIAVSAQQIAAARRNAANTQAASVVPRDATIPYAPQPPLLDGKKTDWGREFTVKWDRSGQYPVGVRAAYDDHNLYLAYTVQDDSPWINHGRDWQMLFKTGDSVDLQIGMDPSADPQRSGPVPGDVRLLIAPYQNKNIAVLYRHRVTGGVKKPVPFSSPWSRELVDDVHPVERTQIAVFLGPNQYQVQAAIPLEDLGLASQGRPLPTRGKATARPRRGPEIVAPGPGGKAFKADFGVIYGDADGNINVLRSYWSNPATGLVSDVPGEIALTPKLWGTVRFQDQPSGRRP